MSHATAIETGYDGWGADFYFWSCTCGAHGDEDTEAEARAAAELHERLVH